MKWSDSSLTYTHAAAQLPFLFPAPKIRPSACVIFSFFTRALSSRECEIVDSSKFVAQPHAVKMPKKMRNLALSSWAGETVKCSFDVTSSVSTPFLISCKISLFPLMMLVSPLSWALCYENKIVSEMCSSSPLRWRLLLCYIFIAAHSANTARPRSTGNCYS